MEALVQDIRYALRQLRHNRGYTLTAVVTLALGIGVTSTIYSVFNGLVFRPLPVAEPGRLVVMGTLTPGLDAASQVTYPDFRAIRERRDLFDDVAAYTTETVNLLGAGRATRAWIDEVSANYFAMLGVRPFLGRTFVPGEDVGTLAHPVAVLSYDFWRRTFDGDSGVVGRTVRLNDHPITIVGVAAPGFVGTSSLLETQAFVPIDQAWPAFGPSLESRTGPSFKVIGRLAHGVTVAQARSGLEDLARRLAHDFPATNRSLRFAVEPETRARPDIAVAGELNRVAVVFLALVGLVLVIACANLANLSLVRAAARARELAVRTALGASRWRIARQLVAEHLLVAMLGGGLGLAAAAWTTGVLRSIPLAVEAPIRLAISPDARVFLFTLVVSVAAGLLSGLPPALRATGRALTSALKDGPRTLGGARQRLRGGLVVAQFAVSLVVLVAAGLFTRSLLNAGRLDLGFRPDHLLMLTTDLTLRDYDAAHGRQFYRDLVTRAAALPGVRHATLSTFVPFGYDNSTYDVYPEAPAQGDADTHLSIFYNAVAPGYFTTLGMPLLSGRDFSAHDDSAAPRVAIVSDVLARRFWPGEDAVGRRIRLERNGPAVEIVGVVRGARYLWLSESPRPFVFLPFAQAYRPEAFLQARTSGDPAGLGPSLAGVVHDLDPELPVYDERTMAAHLHNGRALLFVRLGALLAAAFGLLAACLAAVGLFGVMAYTVAQRSREMGLRMALGARAGDVLRLTLRQGLAVSVAGIALGMGLASVAVHGLSGLLIGVGATDVATFLSAAVLLSGTALAASWIPARRATNVDPMVVLRTD